MCSQEGSLCPQTHPLAPEGRILEEASILVVVTVYMSNLMCNSRAVHLCPEVIVGSMVPEMLEVGSLLLVPRSRTEHLEASEVINTLNDIVINANAGEQYEGFKEATWFL